MVKLPVVLTHPATGEPLPVNVQVPVTEPPVSTSLPDGPPVPVRGPVRVRVLLPDCTVNVMVPVTA